MLLKEQNAENRREDFDYFQEISFLKSTELFPEDSNDHGSSGSFAGLFTLCLKNIFQNLGVVNVSI